MECLLCLSSVLSQYRNRQKEQISLHSRSLWVGGVEWQQTSQNTKCIVWCTVMSAFEKKIYSRKVKEKTHHGRSDVGSHWHDVRNRGMCLFGEIDFQEEITKLNTSQTKIISHTTLALCFPLWRLWYTGDWGRVKIFEVRPTSWEWLIYEKCSWGKHARWLELHIRWTKSLLGKLIV